jgi:hypothetical protein
MREDLPTFDRPMMATSGMAGAGNWEGLVHTLSSPTERVFKGYP